MAIAKIKFNVPVQIKNALGKRETFKPGTYDFDDKVVDHWFISGLIACGKAVILEQVANPDPVKSRQQEVSFTAPAAPPASVKKEEPINKSTLVNLGTAEGNVEIEEIKPSPKKKMEVGESIAAPKEEVKEPVLKRKKREK